MFRFRINRFDSHVGKRLDVLLTIKIRRSKRDPVFGRSAREIILRKIRPIVRQKFVSADQRDRPVVTFAAQHFRRGVASCARANDYHARI